MEEGKEKKKRKQSVVSSVDAIEKEELIEKIVSGFECYEEFCENGDLKHLHDTIGE